MQTYWNWFVLGPIPSNALAGSYDYRLVILSYIIAVIASYLALDIAGRMRAENNQLSKFYWLLAGAFAMGAGIWSMHFIGMLAFDMNMPMEYEPSLTIISMLTAILAAGLAFLLLQKEDPNKIYMWIGGIFLGLAIVSMHYMGMTAMQSPHMSQILYKPGLFFLSILIAILAAEGALWLGLQTNKGSIKRQVRLKSLSALVMGVAICGMHYIGMTAAVFLPGHNFFNAEQTLPSQSLNYYMVIIAAAIILLALLVSTFEQIKKAAVQHEKDFLNAVLENLNNAVIASNTKGKITFSNNTFHTLFHIPKNQKIPEEQLKHFYLNTPHEANNPFDIENLLFQVLQGRRIYALELELKYENKIINIIVNGQPIIGFNGEKIGAILVIYDISQRKRYEEKLLHQATHDIITGLPNRNLLYDHMELAINYANRHQTNLGILFIDLDNFKVFNDLLGHENGDNLLRIVSQRLQQCIRKTDTVARIGGDEFVILVTSLQNSLEAENIALKILNTIKQPITLDNNPIICTVSIGISIYPEDGKDAETLIKNADFAMYQVKAEGRNNIKFFSQKNKERI